MFPGVFRQAARDLFMSTLPSDARATPVAMFKQHCLYYLCLRPWET